MNDETKNETNVAGTTAPPPAALGAETTHPPSSPGITQLGSPTPGTETPVSATTVAKVPLLSDADVADLGAIAERVAGKAAETLRVFTEQFLERVLTIAEQGANTIKASIQEGVAAVEAAKAKSTADASAAVTQQIIAQPMPDPTVTATQFPTVSTSRHDEAVAHIMSTMGYTENLAKQTVLYRGGAEVVLAQRDAAQRDTDAATEVTKAFQKSRNLSD